MRKSVYELLTTKEIKPKGWLLDQLKIQANGLSGNLDKVWGDIRDSAWVGGNCEGWERVPYWLDGFVPLAFLLEDDDMIARAKKYIDAIIAGQKEDGWICPCKDEERGRYDMWALILIAKVLALYADCTGDERIEGVLKRALFQFNNHIAGNTLFGWGQYRWFECLIPIYWLYERCPEDWLLDLAVTIYSQGAGYRELFENWRDTTPERRWGFQPHVVNLAMAFKAEALVSKITKKELDSDELAELMYQNLMEYHGMAVGHFTGDECISGNSPIQGTELCSVAEAMFSYETIFGVNGKVKWIDRLEQLAFNAFPATNSPDMWTHQYDQQTNQIECSRFKDKVIFRTNSGESNLFGLEPNYGCCTANFNQAWPKFALATFMKSEDGIVSAALAPAQADLEINGAAVSVSLDTLYPFRDTLTYTVKTEKPCEFTLGIRIPGFVKSAAVEGKNAAVGEMFNVRKTWSGEETVEVKFEMEFEFVNRPEDMFALRRGPLFYSVAIDEDWQKLEFTRNGVERKFPYCDYEIFAKSKWNYAFAGDDFEVCEHVDFDCPFSTKNPPISVIADMVEIDWGLEAPYVNVCARVPKSREPLTAPAKIKLIPYGCTNLRMTEMPKI